MFSNFLHPRGKEKIQDIGTDTEVRKAKVLIGVPGFAGMIPECQENFFQMAYRMGRDCPEFDFYLRIVIKREQFRARNTLVDLAIVNGCDYLLMLDDDMTVPADLFKRLVAHNKDVIGALYYQRGGAYHPVIMRQYSRKDGLKGINFINHFDPMLAKPGLYKIKDGVIGGGCMLFKTEVFNKIQQPYFWIDGIVGTDVHICNKLGEANIDVWVDTSIELGHVGDPVTYTSRNIPQYGQKLGEVNEQLWEDLREHYVLNDMELEQKTYQAAGDRTEIWRAKPRDTWESVREFYQGKDPWPVFNLALYNLKYDQARDWAINDMSRMVKPGSRVADVGCGLGYVSVPLAAAGYNVTAIDLAGTAAMELLEWRQKKHKLDTMHVLPHDTAVPPDLPEQQDMVLMISVWDHLFDGIGILDWIERNTHIGSYVLCDSWRGQPLEEEPQHINAMEPNKFIKEMKRRGFVETPENPILFKREK